MTEAECMDALRDALRERLAVIADHSARDRDPAAHLERLAAASGEIDRLTALLPEKVDPQLAHFLERRSYDKALALLSAE